MVAHEDEDPGRKGWRRDSAGGFEHLRVRRREVEIVNGPLGGQIMAWLGGGVKR